LGHSFWLTLYKFEIVLDALTQKTIHKLCSTDRFETRIFKANAVIFKAKVTIYLSLRSRKVFEDPIPAVQ